MILNTPRCYCPFPDSIQNHLGEEDDPIECLSNQCLGENLYQNLMFLLQRRSEKSDTFFGILKKIS